jgi:hypothetical protein
VAYIEDVQVADAEVTALSTREDGLAFVKTVIWLAYERNKDRSIKVPAVFGIKISVKLSKLRPIIVLLVGEP